MIGGGHGGGARDAGGMRMRRAIVICCRGGGCGGRLGSSSGCGGLQLEQDLGIFKVAFDAVLDAVAAARMNLVALERRSAAYQMETH